jgi:hypothetical protein
MLKVEINSYKTDELETEEFNTLIQFAKKVRNTESNTQPSEAHAMGIASLTSGHAIMKYLSNLITISKASTSSITHR